MSEQAIKDRLESRPIKTIPQARSLFVKRFILQEALSSGPAGENESIFLGEKKNLFFPREHFQGQQARLGSGKRVGGGVEGIFYVLQCSLRVASMPSNMKK